MVGKTETFDYIICYKKKKNIMRNLNLKNFKRSSDMGKNNSRNIILATIGGLAAGAIAGLLLAPEKGKETRKKIVDESKRFGTNVKDSVSKGYNDVSGRMNEMLHRSTESGEELAENSKEKKEKASERAKASASNGSASNS